MTWHPIETAPDNQFILVLAPHLAIELGIKCEGRFHVTCGEMYPIYTCDEEKIVLGTYATMPTHWMPLPKPPKAIDNE